MNFKRNVLTGWEMPEDPEWATGRSTAIALQLLGKAIENPGVAISIRDHFGTHDANIHLMHMMKQMVKDLSLRGMVFTKQPTVTFRLWERQ